MPAPLHPGIGEGDSRTIWQPGSRSLPSDRRLVNWPLPPVEMDVRVAEDDFGGEWPPTRASKRQQRLRVYDSLYRGDLSHFCNDPDAVRLCINYPGRFCEVMSMLMISAEPPAEVSKSVSAATISMLRSGGAYLVRVDGAFESPRASDCWLDESGEWLWVVEPYVSMESQSGDADRAEVLVVPREGDGERFDVSYEAGHIGSLEEGESVPGCAFAIVPRPPEDDGRSEWGKSALDDIIPPTFGIASILSRNESILAAHQFPTLILPMATAQAQKTLLRSTDTNPGTFTNRMVQQAVRDSFLTNDVLWAGDGVKVDGAKYLTWDGQIDGSFRQLDEMKASVRMLLGIAAALEQESGDTPSGAALRQMNFFLLAHGMQLTAALNDGYAQIGGPQIPSAFDMRQVPAVPETEETP